jgi:ankyrin repeat protein
VKFLLDKGADVNVKYNHSRTSLIFASQHGNVDVVKLLVDKGADVNVKDISGRTALMYINLYANTIGPRISELGKILQNAGAK